MKKWSYCGGLGRGSGLGGPGGCERRIEVFVKIQKKKIGGGGGCVCVWGGQGGCEWRIEVFVKIKKKIGGGGWGGSGPAGDGGSRGKGLVEWEGVGW